MTDAGSLKRRNEGLWSLILFGSDLGYSFIREAKNNVVANNVVASKFSGARVLVIGDDDDLYDFALDTVWYGTLFYSVLVK